MFNTFGGDFLKLLSVVFKNIQKFIKHKPMLFTFLIISQIVCVIAIMLVCCITDNANRSEKVIKEGITQFTFVLTGYDEQIYTDGEGNYFHEDGTEFSKEEEEEWYNSKYPDGYFSKYSTFKDFKPKMDELIEFMGDDYDGFSIFGAFNDTRGSLPFSAGPHDNDYLQDISAELKEFHKSTEHIVRLDAREYKDVFGKILKVGDKIDLYGTEYTVAIVEDNVACLNIPYAVVEDNFKVISVWSDTKEQCSAERCDEIEKKIKEIFELNDDKVYPPEPRVLEELQNVNMAYGVTAAVILMLLLNISRVYMYVLSRRKKSLAVMSICGSSKDKLFAIYLIELMATLIVTFGIGILIFHTLILPPMAQLYPNFLKFISPSVYMRIFGIYIVVALIIMSLTISSFITKSSVEMERSGK